MAAHPLSFRLGATSYVYRGDLVHNATRLAGQVQDIELVLYVTSGGENNLPTRAEVVQLAQTATDTGLTYTVHLPRDLRSDGGDSLELAQRVIELCAPLQPHAYVMHVDGDGVGTAAWRAQAIDALAQVTEWAGDPKLIALENLESYAPEHLLPLFAALPIARTLDIGHLWKAGIDPLPVIDQWLMHSRIVHIHGVRVEAGAIVDHGTLAWTARTQLAAVLERLRGWTGVLTLEVFEDDFFTSRTALDEALTAATQSPARGQAPRPT